MRVVYLQKHYFKNVRQSCSKYPSCRQTTTVICNSALICSHFVKKIVRYTLTILKKKSPPGLNQVVSTISGVSTEFHTWSLDVCLISCMINTFSVRCINFGTTFSLLSLSKNVYNAIQFVICVLKSGQQHHDEK